ncbi:HNH endonuclease [Mycolicibacterium sphagni]|nr:HNH endonuclease [Mycolicibacterium sphagni]
MPEGRPDIPAQMKRDVLVEAGHRCAIPTCRSAPVQINHIVPWATLKEHTFDNLIALCGTCHDRYTRGDIDQKSMRQYKANLSVVNETMLADTVRALQEKLAQLERIQKLEQNQPQPQASDPAAQTRRTWIASTVLEDRVREEAITQTGPGDTHVQLLVTGPPISAEGHAQRLLRIYQGYFDAPSVDLIVTTDGGEVNTYGLD